MKCHWPKSFRFPYRLGWLGFLGIVFLTSAVWGLEIPPLTGRVVDKAQLLSPTAASKIDSALAAHESQTSNQLVVLTLPSLEGQPLEEFSHQVATAWALGQKGTDNGVLFLIAVKEKKLRIEVGYGLEGTLTDAKSSRIIRHEVVPRFRAGDFSGGVVAGVNAILGTIEGTYTNPNSSSPTATPYMGLWGTFALAVAIGTIFGFFLGAGPRSNGSVIGGIVAFIVGVGAAFWVGVFAGATALFLVSLFSNRDGGASYDPFARESGLGWPGRSWPIGGPMGGSGGFGGGLGGGFGGGGGGFGGGGASGGW